LHSCHYLGCLPFGNDGYGDFLARPRLHPASGGQQDEQGRYDEQAFGVHVGFSSSAENNRLGRLKSRQRQAQSRPAPTQMQRFSGAGQQHRWLMTQRLSTRKSSIFTVS
jgi:hypothetical protein